MHGARCTLHALLNRRRKPRGYQPTVSRQPPTASTWRHPLNLRGDRAPSNVLVFGLGQDTHGDTHCEHSCSCTTMHIRANGGAVPQDEAASMGPKSDRSMGWCLHDGRACTLWRLALSRFLSRQYTNTPVHCVLSSTSMGFGLPCTMCCAHGGQAWATGARARDDHPPGVIHGEPHLSKGALPLVRGGAVGGAHGAPSPPAPPTPTRPAPPAAARQAGQRRTVQGARVAEAPPDQTRLRACAAGTRPRGYGDGHGHSTGAAARDGAPQAGDTRVFLWLRAPAWRREDARPRTAGHSARVGNAALW